MSQTDVVRDFVIENFLYGEDGRLQDDTSFLGSSIIDSTGVLELVSFLEGTYHITINDDEMVPENLDSLNNIDQFLKGKLNGQRPR
jgi:acyl carrier protein